MAAPERNNTRTLTFSVNLLTRVGVLLLKRRKGEGRGVGKKEEEEEKEEKEEKGGGGKGGGEEKRSHKPPLPLGCADSPSALALEDGNNQEIDHIFG